MDVVWGAEWEGAPGVLVRAGDGAGETSEGGQRYKRLVMRKVRPGGVVYSILTTAEKLKIRQWN